MEKTSNVKKTTLRKLLVVAFALAIISPIAKAQTMGGDNLKIVEFNSDIHVRNKTVVADNGRNYPIVHSGHDPEESKQASGAPCRVYYPFRKGAQLEYTIYDHKDKVSGYLSQQITEVKNTAKGLKITAQSQHLNKKRKLNYSGKVHMRCEGNVFYADVRNLLDPKSIQAFQNDSQVEISGIDAAIPGNIQVGKTLPDAKITLKIKTKDIPLPPTVISVKQRKVLAREKISTPAGSFDCYKISSEFQIESIINIRMKTIEWIAPDVGTVQSETYNDKDKCIAKMQLSSFEE